MPDGAALPGLAAHLHDAIRLNTARRALYRRRGGPRADALSRALVAAERTLLPVAVWFDRQAAPFAARGIPVIVGDVVSMDGVPDAEAPVGHVGPLSAADGAAVRDALRTLRAHIRASLSAGDLAQSADAVRDALASVRQAETASGCHLALTAHVLESAGFAAANGVRWADLSEGATRPLSVRFVQGHLLLLGAALRLDRAAHPVHARGAGLFVNDLPPIPFPGPPHA